MNEDNDEIAPSDDEELVVKFLIGLTSRQIFEEIYKFEVNHVWKIATKTKYLR